MNLILCGLKNSGKSTVGQLLSEKLGCHFIDTDRRIEERYGDGSSCREIFLKEGMLRFRALEKEAVASLKGVKNTIIATGGGTLHDPDNRIALQTIGKFVYLKATANNLWHRFQTLPPHLDQDNPEKSFLEIAKTRIPLYEEVAYFTIETDSLTPREIVDMIGELYG